MISEFRFEAIGTSWRISLYQEISSDKSEFVVGAIKSRIAAFDVAYSRFRDDSLVSEMARRTGTFELPDDASVMMATYRGLYDATNGLVTPLVGQMLVDAGYDATYSLRQARELTPALQWNDVIHYEHPNLIIKKPALLDFGAMGKGYLVDLVGGVLEENGITHYCVDAGGDIRHRNNEALRIALEDPEDTSKAIGVIELHNQSLCGSATNRRAWGKFHHVMDPKRAESVRGILAVWVVAQTTILADGLATALFFVPPETLLEKYDFEYVVVNADRSIRSSKFFEGTLFVS